MLVAGGTDRLHEDVADRRVVVFVQVLGSCVENAATDRRPSYLCQSDGNWYSHGAGGCLCRPGYQPSDDFQRCTGL